MRELTSVTPQLGYRNGLSSLSRNLRESGLRVEGSNDIAILAPTAATCGVGIAQRDRLAAVDAGFLELPLGKKSNPLSVWREKRSIGSFRARQCGRVRLVKPSRKKPAGSVRGLRDKRESCPVGRQDSRRSHAGPQRYISAKIEIQSHQGLQASWSRRRAPERPERHNEAYR